MKELHVLVDFENVQPSLEELAKLAPGFTDVWLFHGPHQTKQAQVFAASHERVALVPRSGQGPNALDFHLSFYLGYVAAKHPDAQLVVVANDRGYDPMLAHARMLKFHAKRVGYKAPVAKKTVAPAAEPVVAKKVTAKKAAAKKASAKPAAPEKVVTPKKMPTAKKTPAFKKAVTKKTATPKPAAKAPTPTSKPATTPESKLLARITKGLTKMGDKAPTKLKSFKNALKPMLDKNSTAADIDAMAQALQDTGVVQVQGGVVTYRK